MNSKAQKTKTDSSPAQGDFLKPTFQITVFSGLSFLVGFVTQVVIAAKFGALMERDAFLAAIVLPDYFQVVFLGSLAVTFIPIFIEYEAQKNKDEAWKVASIITNLLLLILTSISIIGFIFAKSLVSISAPGFSGEKLVLTTVLLRIVFPSIVFMGLNNLLTSLYYAQHRYLLPAMAPFLNTVIMFCSVIFLTRYWGIKSLAVGRLVGSIVVFGLLVQIFFKSKRFRLSLDIRNKGVKKIIRIMSPLILVALFLRTTSLVERLIASTLPTGSISYLGYAERIIDFMRTLGIAGISTTVFPLMARSWVENNLMDVRDYLAKGFRSIMLITFPMAMLFFILPVPIIQLVFERGVFDHKDTIAVANVLVILLLALIASGLGDIVGKGFYISQKTKLLAILGVIETSVYLGFAYLLSRYFSFYGLAWAKSIYYIVGLTITLIIMNRIFGGLNGKELFSGFYRIFISSALSGVMVYMCNRLLTHTNHIVLRLMISAGLGIAVYAFLVIYVFKISEAVNVMKKLQNLFHKRYPTIRRIKEYLVDLQSK